jgi:hypothetical protein
MRTGLVVSAVAHASLIALAILGLSFGKQLETTPVESIAVDLVPISEFTNIRQGSLDSKIVETETPSAVDADKPAEIAKPTGNTTEDQPTPTDSSTESPKPTEQTAPAPAPAEPVVEPDPAPAPDAAPTPAERPAEPPPPEPEPAPEPTPDPVQPDPALATPDPTPDPTAAAPKPIVKTAALDQKRAEFKKQAAAKKKAEADAKAAEEAKKLADKKKAEADAKKAADKKKADEQKRIEQAKADDAAKLADDVANIINNEDTRGATTGDGGEKTLGKADGRSATLSQSELDGLASQIKGCISMPAGAEDAAATAELTFTVAADGSVVGQPQITSGVNSDVEGAYARAVSRAVMRCGPYPLVAGQDVKALFRALDF